MHDYPAARTLGDYIGLAALLARFRFRTGPILVALKGGEAVAACDLVRIVRWRRRCRAGQTRHVHA